MYVADVHCAILYRKNILNKIFVNREKSTTFATANTKMYCKGTADMAQLVEQRIRNAWVPGSSPGIGSLHVRRSKR